MTKPNYLFLAWFALAFLTACQDFDYGYKSYEPDTADTYYTRRFANRGDVNVSITTETPGAPYFIYFENPYDAEGNFTGATAYLQGLSPLHTTLSVPHHVDSLYVVSPMREMRVLKAGDVMIEDRNLVRPVSQTRVNITEYPYELPDNVSGHYYFDGTKDPRCGTNPDINDLVINYVNACFPETDSNHPNVRPEDQVKNTDLTFQSSNPDDYVAVWITVLGTGKKGTITNGNKSDGDPEAQVWFYIYEDGADLSANVDFQMYGIKIDANGNASIYGQTLDFSGGNFLSNPALSTEQQTEENPYPTIFIGYVKAGYNIGFCYQGMRHGNGSEGNAKVRYTTPELNNRAHGAGQKPVADGFILHQGFEINGDMHAFNFVAFENRSTSKSGNNYYSDEDFNDILLCIETNPEIRPKEEINVTPTIDKVINKGYYLFEDLYEPGKAVNDNDFNDVVIYYEKAVYNLGTTQSPQWMCDFSAELLANACTNTNEVGVYHNAPAINARKFAMFTGITGENNMETAPKYEHANQEKITFALSAIDDVVLPYLRTTIMNGEPTTYDPTDPNNGNIYTTSYATKDFPYAMEIPFVEGKPFRWMQEGICISKGYNWQKSVRDWYVSPIQGNETNLVPRTAGSTY